MSPAPTASVAPAPGVPAGLPVIGFVGIHSNGRPSMPVSQNETLARLFDEAGYRTRKASGVRRPSLRTLHQVLAILAWRRVDVLVVAVFSGDSFWIADFSTLLARLTGKRSICFLHGGNLPVFGTAHRRRVERALVRADAVLAPSEYLAATFRDWGIDVEVVPNVLPLEGYPFRPRPTPRPRLLWMRTFHEHYDPLTAVRVLHRVAERVPEASMTMAGVDQGLLEATRAEVGRLGVADRVTFAGYVQGDRKRRAFEDHDIFLNTNLVDNMPVSVLEAGACGLVPVATAVGGIPNLLQDGVDAVLAPPGDVDALADAVLGLLADGERYAALSAGARRMAERSGWPEVRRSWESHLRRVVPWRVVPRDAAP